MNKNTQLTTLQSLLCWAFLVSGFIYLYTKHGSAEGPLLFCLLWSLYIICIPGAHGQMLFGFPIRRLTGYDTHPELFLWPAALICNLIAYIWHQEIYTKSFLTMILYRIITVPNPYWTIIIASAIGTFYYFIVGERYFACSKMKHRILRHLITIAGILYFFYAAHREFIILLNATA